MAEKRKPCLIIMLRFPGKVEPKRKWHKLELFRGTEWDGFSDKLLMPLGTPKHRLFRLRINGQWNDTRAKGNVKWFTKWSFRDLLFRSLNI